MSQFYTCDVLIVGRSELFGSRVVMLCVMRSRCCGVLPLGDYCGKLKFGESGLEDTRQEFLD